MMTRDAEETNALRRRLDGFIPFLVGLAIGLLSAFATFNGRITKLEVSQSADESNILRLAGDHDLLQRIADKLGVRP